MSTREFDEKIRAQVEADKIIADAGEDITESVLALEKEGKNTEHYAHQLLCGDRTIHETKLYLEKKLREKAGYSTPIDYYLWVYKKKEKLDRPWSISIIEREYESIDTPEGSLEEVLLERFQEWYDDNEKQMYEVEKDESRYIKIRLFEEAKGD